MVLLSTGISIASCELQTRRSHSSGPRRQAALHGLPGARLAGAIRSKRGMPASPSRLAVELTFLDDALMRLVGTLDAILMVVPLGRKQMRDFVDAAGRAATERPGGVKNALADLELVIAHVSLSVLQKTRSPPPLRRGRTPLLLDSCWILSWNARECDYL